LLGDEREMMSLLAMALNRAINGQTPTGSRTGGLRVTFIVAGILEGLLGLRMLWVVSKKERCDSLRHNFSGFPWQGGQLRRTRGRAAAGALLTITGLCLIAVSIWA